LSVLAEIASRALSPAVNDPGTAIDVINRGFRLLVPWKGYKFADSDEQIIYRHVRVPELELGDLLDDIFMPIERDGTNMIEVQLRLLGRSLWRRSIPSFTADETADRSIFIGGSG
jgi:uncharacterized membrane protein